MWLHSKVKVVKDVLATKRIVQGSNWAKGVNFASLNKIHPLVNVKRKLNCSILIVSICYIISYYSQFLAIGNRLVSK